MVWLLLSSLLLAPADRAARLDPDGVLRWADDGREVATFGVNYYPPFSIDYAALGQLGADRRQVIDQDLLHFRRLGLDALRLHCWDREISDREGNLLDNEHLALLDHLLAEAKRQGIHTVLTPIAWWGTQNESPGFSTLYPMPRMTTDPGAPRAAQRRFLAQFVQHRNRETGLTYAEDPAILAFELINEPLYPPDVTDAQVTEYINALAAAIRETGCRKPLFYNGWAGKLTATGRSSIDGVTFGWYPTGLINGAMLTDNYLPRVDDYPSMRDPAIAGKAIGVYEFDAADVGGSYLYPAMARAFRKGGAQFAHQFQYDAWPTAASNANWRTHFLSLPFAPGKAISFMIAAEAFRRLPRREGLEPLAADGRFGPFRVSHAEDLSELVTETELVHSNTTATRPPAPERLVRLAGVGSNPLVRCDGTGAWFLDRLAPGVWRLEVYPDAVWVDDPFGPTNLGRETARLVWAERRMSVALPDLGAAFAVEPLNEGNAHRPAVAEGAFAVRPGVYVLRRPGAADGVEADRAFFAPPPADGPPALWHRAPDYLVAEAQPVTLRATSTEDDAGVTLFTQQGGTWRRTPMRRTAPYAFEAALPAGSLEPGLLRYAMVVERGGQPVSFPGGLAQWPDQVAAAAPLALFRAADLAQAPEFKPSTATGGAATLADGALAISVEGFDVARNGSAGLRVPARAATLPTATALRLRMRALQPGTSRVEVGFVQDDGRAYGYEVPLGTSWQDIDVPLDGLRPLWSTPGGKLDPARLKEVSFVFGTWLYGETGGRQPHGFAVQAIDLVPWQAAWQVPVEPVGPPVPLLHVAPLVRGRPSRQGTRVAQVPGPREEPAFELAHTGFGPPPDSTGINQSLDTPSPARLAAMGQATKLRLTLRGATPATTQAEVVLTEEDGSPWGTIVPLSPEWQTIEVPLADLKFFSWWTRVEGRGGEGDRLNPAAVRRWRITLGAWLNPEHAAEPHAVQVAGMELVR